MPRETSPVRRHNIRLTNYDYASAGAYFITICTHHRTLLFEDSRFAAVVGEAWRELPLHYASVALDAFVVMPNHVHGILNIDEPDPAEGAIGVITSLSNGLGMAGLKPAPNGRGLPELVRASKTFSGRGINRLRDSPGQPVWQRGYFEHIIRNARAPERIREYIVANPARWDVDHENPVARPDAAETNFWRTLPDVTP